MCYELNEKILNEYLQSLKLQEKSRFTIDKYKRDILSFIHFLDKRKLNKEIVIEYKRTLNDSGYAKSSINSMLTSINCLFSYLKYDELKIKGFRLQKEIYIRESKQLNKSDYQRLLMAASKDEKTYLMLQTFAATGIRVSELSFFTAEEVAKGEIKVSCKNKTRTIIIPKDLKVKLLSYIKKHSIASGPIFLGKTGKALNRSVIWKIMKGLCKAAGVLESKVFPHNFRKLFARTFYNIEKDIAKLADILGHYNINTTRIYLMSSEKEHRRLIDRLGLIT